MTDSELSSSNSASIVPLLDVLQKTKNNKVSKATSFVTTGYGLYTFYKTIEPKIRPPHYNIEVSSQDELFKHVLDELTDYLSDKTKHNVMAKTHKTAHNNVFTQDDSSELFVSKKKLVFTYSGTKPQQININNHKIKVSFSEKNKKHFIVENIIFTAKNLQGRKAVIDFLENINKKANKKNNIAIFSSNQWGELVKKADIEKRDIDSVILPTKIKESIIGDIDLFLKEKERYKKLDIPYRRGYLLYGPPGTGKTSLIKAIASHYDMDLYLFPLQGIKEDYKLIDAVSSVPPHSVIAIEDIDTIDAAKTRKTKRDTLSLSGLANALDGVTTPNEVLIFLTTNVIEALDDAIIRDGRADMKILLDYANSEQVNKIYENFYPGTKFDKFVVNDLAQVAPAKIFNICKKNIYNPQKAYKQIEKVINYGPIKKEKSSLS